METLAKRQCYSLKIMHVPGAGTLHGQKTCAGLCKEALSSLLELLGMIMRLSNLT